MVPKASKRMNIRFQWLKCRHAHQLFKYLWAWGTTNRADYPSKHPPTKHHWLICPRYVRDPPWAQCHIVSLCCTHMVTPRHSVKPTLIYSRTELSSIWMTYAHKYWWGCADLAVVSTYQPVIQH
jgi:hypothetical protein